MRPLLMRSSGLPSSLITRPFFTVAMTPQLAMQARQQVFTLRMVSRSFFLSPTDFFRSLRLPTTSSSPSTWVAARKSIFEMETFLLIALPFPTAASGSTFWYTNGIHHFTNSIPHI